MIDPTHPDRLASTRPPTPLADRATNDELVLVIERARVTAAGPPAEASAGAPVVALRDRPAAGRRRTATIATAAVLAVGGMSAAAATVASDWAPWAQQPDHTLTYTLPSGAQCEQRIGGMTGDDPAVIAAAKEFARTHDLMSLADIDGVIARFRTGNHVNVDENGIEYPAPYGTPRYFNPDAEYQVAVSQALNELIGAELDRQGFDAGEAGFSFLGEARCPGAQW